MVLSKLQWIGAALAALLVTHAIAFWAGWLRGYDAAEAVWAKEKLEILAAAEARAKVLRERGDRLAADLEQARANVRVEYVEKIRVVVRTAKATKECLAPDVTAALNRQPIRETVERPNAPPRTVEHPPAGGTSEAAAAEWIANAQAQHEQCRAQVARLVDWVRAVTGSR